MNIIDPAYPDAAYGVGQRLKIKKGAPIYSADERYYAHPDRKYRTGSIFPRLTKDHVVVLRYYSGLDYCRAVNWNENGTRFWTDIEYVEPTEDLPNEYINIDDITDYLLTSEEIREVC